MDDLNSLPEMQNASTPQEIQVLQKYFNNAASNNKDNSVSSGTTNWKFISYTTVLFIALANPFIDTFLSKVPYLGGESGMVPETTRLIAKAILFFVLFFFLQRYLA